MVTFRLDFIFELAFLMDEPAENDLDLFSLLLERVGDGSGEGAGEWPRAIFGDRVADLSGTGSSDP